MTKSYNQIANDIKQFRNSVQNAIASIYPINTRVSRGEYNSQDLQKIENAVQTFIKNLRKAVKGRQATETDKKKASYLLEIKSNTVIGNRNFIEDIQLSESEEELLQTINNQYPQLQVMEELQTHLQNFQAYLQQPNYACTSADLKTLYEREKAHADNIRRNINRIKEDQNLTYQFQSALAENDLLRGEFSQYLTRIMHAGIGITILLSDLEVIWAKGVGYEFTQPHGTGYNDARSSVRLNIGSVWIGSAMSEQCFDHAVNQTVLDL